MAKEIIWTDKATGQKFVLDNNGEKIFIMSDGSRIYESDIILDKMVKEYEALEAEEKERRDAEEAYKAAAEQEMEEYCERVEEEEAYEAAVQDEEDIWYWFYGPGSHQGD